MPRLFLFFALNFLISALNFLISALNLLKTAFSKPIRFECIISVIISMCTIRLVIAVVLLLV